MARVLVLGSTNTDLTLHLSRLPGSGETVLGGTLLTGPGGKGANQAVAAARAGAQVTFITSVGDDTFGKRALALFEREGIDAKHSRICPGVPSGVALIFVGDRGENMIGVGSGANAELSSVDIERLPESLFDDHAVLLIAGIEVPIDAVKAMVGRARGKTLKVVLNPAPVPSDRVDETILKYVDVVTPNRGELELLTGISTASEDGLVRAARELPVRNVVVTLGSEGCLFLESGEVRKLPAHRVLAVDTVAAGDAFSGALAVALAEGKSLFEAASWANAAGALAVTIHGAQDSLPSREAIDRQASRRYV